MMAGVLNTLRVMLAKNGISYLLNDPDLTEKTMLARGPSEKADRIRILFDLAREGFVQELLDQSGEDMSEEALIEMSLNVFADTGISIKDAVWGLTTWSIALNIYPDEQMRKGLAENIRESIRDDIADSVTDAVAEGLDIGMDEAEKYLVRYQQSFIEACNKRKR